MKLLFNMVLVWLVGYFAMSEAVANTDKYRLSWRQDPATSMVIGWNQVSGSQPKVFYGEKDFGQDWKKYPKSNGVDHQTRYGVLNNRFARLTGLKADTAYYFVIKDSQGISKRFWFKTAPDKPQPFTFVAGGDSRSNPEARRLGNRLVSKLRPLFVLFGGDYTGAGAPKQWAEWFKDWQLTVSADGRIYPLIAAHGNHENRDMQMVYKLFDAPNPDMYFSLGIAGDMMRIWTLNSELEGDVNKWDTQSKWLKSDLKKYPNVTWKIADYHRPMRPHTARKAEGLERIKAWAQLFYDNGVDLVIESDTHMVKRTYPLRPSKAVGSYESFIRDDKKGTVYIGEGSWGAPTRPVNDNKPWTLASGSFHQFKWFQVTETHLDSRVVKFEKVDEVEALTEKNLFMIPKGLVLWNPKTGSVLRLPFDTKTVKGAGETIIAKGEKWQVTWF